MRLIPNCLPVTALSYDWNVNSAMTSSFSPDVTSLLSMIRTAGKSNPVWPPVTDSVTARMNDLLRFVNSSMMSQVLARLLLQTLESERYS